MEKVKCWIVYFWLTNITRFGWTNASVIHGLCFLDIRAKTALGKCTPYEVYANVAKTS